MNYADKARRLLMKRINNIGKNAQFARIDYRHIKVPSDAVIYCDPPYGNGEISYNGTPEFDSTEFWRYMAAWSRRAYVFISESSAPDGWIPVWTKEQRTNLAEGSTKHRRQESLFIYGPDWRV